MPMRGPADATDIQVATVSIAWRSGTELPMARRSRVALRPVWVDLPGSGSLPPTGREARVPGTEGPKDESTWIKMDCCALGGDGGMDRHHLFRRRGSSTTAVGTFSQHYPRP